MGIDGVENLRQLALRQVKSHLAEEHRTHDLGSSSV